MIGKLQNLSITIYSLMKKIDKIIIRLDAGNYYGLGHLSRCISIVNGIEAKMFLFLIKTDNQKKVLDFIEVCFKKKFKIQFLTKELLIKDEVDLITSHYNLSDLVIIDHYDADEYYQLKLFDKKVEWFQLDSHAKVNFYARWVMHGSPGATEELYEPLRKNKKTEFLLGTNYCIIKDQVLALKKKRSRREFLQKIIICFGGGDDRGATIKCVENIDFELLDKVKFYISISSYNKDYDKIISYQTRGLVEIIAQNKLHLKMKESDLALVAPGMISYEAAFLGLPMVLISIADNQFINAKSWESYGCAINIGSMEEVETNLNKVLGKLRDHPQKLQVMSENCLDLVDGKGVRRIVDHITKT